VETIPHLIGISREPAARRIGTWISSLFDYQAPRFGFRPAERRLLLTALAGNTDQELGNELGISTSAVKKTWRAIYDRVALCDAEVIPEILLMETARQNAERKRSSGCWLIFATIWRHVVPSPSNKWTQNMTERYRPMRPHDVRECVVLAFPIDPRTSRHASAPQCPTPWQASSVTRGLGKPSRQLSDAASRIVKPQAAPLATTADTVRPQITL